MTGSRRSSLPYDMGNAGDLLKHGVLAEFVRWRLERGASVRFLDLFAGEPSACVVPETVKRVRGLTESALAKAQSEIDECRYFGSSKLVRNLGQRHDGSNVCVFVNDCDLERLKKLRACGLKSLNKAFPTAFDRPGSDAYAAFKKNRARGARSGRGVARSIRRLPTLQESGNCHSTDGKNGGASDCYSVRVE